MNFLLFTLAAVVAVFIAFFAIPVNTGEFVVLFLGYPHTLLCVCLWIYALYRSFQPVTNFRHLFTKDDIYAALIIAAGTLLFIIAEPFEFKVLHDEVLLSSTAQMMHFERLPAVAQAANLQDGSLLLTNAFLDKRPLFFPFLLSLLHDMTGYRVENAFALNAILTPVLLLLVYLLARKLSDRISANLTLLLLISLPLLATNTNSGHFELLNLTMLTGAFLLAYRYVEKPDSTRLSALIFHLILLAQTRYESAIYLLPFGLLILLGWFKNKQVLLPASAYIAPFLLILPTLQYRVTIAHPIMYWQEGPFQRADSFSLSYFFQNTGYAASYLFQMGQQYSNSLLLSLCGLAAVWAAIPLIRKYMNNWKQATASDWIITSLWITSLLSFLFVMLFYWGVWTYHATNRLSLALQLCLSVLFPVILCRQPRGTLITTLLFCLVYGVWTFALMSPVEILEKGVFIGTALVVVSFAVAISLKATADLRWTVIAITVAFILTVTIPVSRNHRYMQKYMPPHVYQFFDSFVNNHPGQDYLIASSRPLGSVLRNKPTTSLQLLSTNIDIVENRIRDRIFSDIFIFQVLEKNTQTGAYEASNGNQLADALDTELLEERFFYPMHLARILRVTGVNPRAGTGLPSEDSSQSAVERDLPELSSMEPPAGHTEPLSGDSILP